jgi:hypothetical protein
MIKFFKGPYARKTRNSSPYFYPDASEYPLLSLSRVIIVWMIEGNGEKSA